MSNRRGVSPRASNRGVRTVPRSPAPPVSTTFMPSLPGWGCVKLAPCGRTVLVDLVPDSPPIRTGHDGQRIGDESLGLTSAVLPAWAVSWALTTPRPLCLLAGYLVAVHNVPA